MIRLLLLLCCCLLSTTTYRLVAQINTSTTEYYSLQEGLSDRTIRSIVRGRDSLIWVGTANGLNKFDGYNFTVFNSDPDDTLRLISSNIQRLATDPLGRLYILYENITWQFNIFDPLTYDLRKVEIGPSTGVLGLVRAIEVDDTGDMFVLTVSETEDSTRLYRFDQRTGFEPVFALYQPHGQRKNYQLQLHHLSNGDFLINDSALGLQLLDATGQIRKYFQPSDLTHPADNSKLPYPNRVAFVHEDRFGQLWLAWENVPGIFSLRFGDMYFERKAEFDQNSFYTSIWEDKPGNLLVLQSDPARRATDISKVLAYTPRGALLPFSHLIEANTQITTLFSEDFFKTIFLGIEDGLSVVRNNRFRIRSFAASSPDDGRWEDVMRGITGDSYGFVYFAQQQGPWYRLDVDTDVLDTLFFIETSTGRMLELECGVNLLNDQVGHIWGAACDSNNGGRLFKYNTENCTVEDYRVPYRIAAIEIGADGLFWLACSLADNNGILLRFDPGSGRYWEFYFPERSNPLQGFKPNYIHESSQGDLWVGTDNGVLVLDIRATTVIRYHTDAQDARYRISHNSCLLIHEEDDGAVYLGTLNGLNIINRSTDKIRVLRRRDGLANNAVCGILPDGNGNYWISTYNGVSFYNPTESSFKNFYRADGFNTNKFEPFSFYRDQNGRFYFGSANGVNAFLPKDLLLHEPKPTVLLTKIERYRSTNDSLLVQESNLHDIKQLVIEPFDTYFALHFTFPEFSRPTKNQYRMKLGPSQKWSYLNNDPVIQFHKLPAGTYTLFVEGADANGNWSAHPFILPIRVKKPFYEKTWVWVLFAMLVFSLAYSVFRSRLEQRLKMEQLRTKLASDLHDEMSGLLSGIAMQSDLVQFMVSDVNIQSRLKTIGEVSRKAMSKMSDVIWSIDSRKDQLEDLIGRMYEHADEVLLPLNIRYDISVSHKLDQQQRVPANIRQDLYFIYKESINNIAKHSNADRVFIMLRQQGNFFEMIIRDNGTPKPDLPVHEVDDRRTYPKEVDRAVQLSTTAIKNKSKGGQGISNLQMRAERLKADLKINKERGYIVTLRMKKFM